MFFPDNRLRSPLGQSIMKLLTSKFKLDRSTYHPPHVFYNLTRREKQGLRWLQSQPDLEVIPADKNVGVCIMSTADYNRYLTEELQRTPDSFQLFDGTEEDLHAQRRSMFREMYTKLWFKDNI